MNQSLKSLLALVILFSLGASVLGWTTRGIEGVPESRLWLRASGVILLPAITLLVWADFRRDQAPDFLRKCVRRCFERGGLCFVILPSARNGNFAWQVFFQNRFERPCKAMVAFRPAGRILGSARRDLGEVRVDIDCEGSAFGVVSVPLGLDPKYQGKKLKFELIAATEFPGGKGRMVRFREGLAVGKHHKTLVDTALTAITVAALHPHFIDSATFKARLPRDVATRARGEVTQEILWRPGDSLAEVAR